MNNSDKTVSTENAPAKKLDKRILIIIISLASALLLVGAGFLIDYLLSPNEPLNVPDTGETIDGVYTVNVSVGTTGSYSYIFEGNKVTESYPKEGETVTNVFTYVIAIENGEKVIKLTDEVTNKTTTHGFYTGTFDGKPFISINEQHYYKQTPTAD